MNNRSVKGMLIFLFILLSLYFVLQFVPGIPFTWAQKKLNLGLDLKGGMQLLLEVDFSEVNIKKADKENAVQSAIEIIRNRIDQFGVSEPSIQRIGDNRILVQLPGIQEFERARNLIGKTARLEFKLVAEQDEYEKVLTNVDTYLKKNIEKYAFLKEVQEELAMEDSDVASDILDDVADTTATEEEAVETDLLDEEDKVFTNLINSGDTPYTIAYDYVGLFKELIKDPSFKKAFPSNFQLVLGKDDKDDPKSDRPFYILYSNPEITGDYLDDASTSTGKNMSDPKTYNKPIISLEFNRNGAKKFANITGQNKNRMLAIVLDDVVYMAPRINDRIPDGRAIISGVFNMMEAHDLVIVLKAGNLPAPVNIIERKDVGATLGTDSINAGKRAGLIGLIVVAIFMLVYYKIGGVFANIALVLNISFTLSILTLFGATLTMPGIAGLILTIGMAVDANVLIFERIREELASGKTIRSAVDAGFARAMITIADSNITTLIAAIVLYNFGTGPIRGFAVTLGIGIIGSMFTAIVIVKALFNTFVTSSNRDKLSL
ncbi:MAG: protein translocase subunit SecD [Candidatus Zophobacter franzmannii]|nr:protein translocase subunit SecD [Candidatus Zophobacter franzmannii]